MELKGSTIYQIKLDAWDSSKCSIALLVYYKKTISKFNKYVTQIQQASTFDYTWDVAVIY